MVPCAFAVSEEQQHFLLVWALCVNAWYWCCAMVKRTNRTNHTIRMEANLYSPFAEEPRATLLCVWQAAYTILQYTHTTTTCCTSECYVEMEYEYVCMCMCASLYGKLFPMLNIFVHKSHAHIHVVFSFLYFCVPAVSIGIKFIT